MGISNLSHFYIDHFFLQKIRALPFKECFINIFHNHYGVGKIEFKNNNHNLSGLVLLIVINDTIFGGWWEEAIILLALIILLYVVRKYEEKSLYEYGERLRLKEMNLLKSQLYTNITREFQSPLTVILGMVDTIKGHQFERNLIRTNVINLLLLLNQASDLEKIDIGILKLKNCQSEIVNYLKYLTVKFYDLAMTKGIKLDFYSEESVLFMDFDVNKIQYIFHILVSNAIKFTENGGVVLLRLSKTSTKNGNNIHFSVQDSGLGIERNLQPQVFDQYSYNEDAHLLLKKGRDLGFELVKDYVQLMGGDISKSSELDEGRKFTISLPITNTAPFISYEKMYLESNEVSISENNYVDNNTVKDNPVLLNGSVKTWNTKRVNA